MSMDMVQESFRPSIEPLADNHSKGKAKTIFRRKPTGFVTAKYPIEEEENVILTNHQNLDHQRNNRNKLEEVENLDHKTEEILSYKSKDKEKSLPKKLSTLSIKISSKPVSINYSLSVTNPENWISKSSEFVAKSPFEGTREGNLRFISFHTKPKSSLPPQPIGDLGNEVYLEEPLFDPHPAHKNKSLKNYKPTPELSRKTPMDIPQNNIQKSFNLEQNSTLLKQKEKSSSISPSVFGQVGLFPDLDSPFSRVSLEYTDQLEKIPKNLISPIRRKGIHQKVFLKPPEQNAMRVLRALRDARNAKKLIPPSPSVKNPQKENDLKLKEQVKFVIAPQSPLRNSNMENFLSALRKSPHKTNLEFSPARHKSYPKNSSKKIRGIFNIAKKKVMDKRAKKTEWERWEEMQLKKNRTMTLSQLAQLKMQRLNEYQPTKH